MSPEPHLQIAQRASHHGRRGAPTRAVEQGAVRQGQPHSRGSIRITQLPARMGLPQHGAREIPRSVARAVGGVPTSDPPRLRPASRTPLNNPPTASTSQAIPLDETPDASPSNSEQAPAAKGVARPSQQLASQGDWLQKQKGPALEDSGSDDDDEEEEEEEFKIVYAGVKPDPQTRGLAAIATATPPAATDDDDRDAPARTRVVSPRRPADVKIRELAGRPTPVVEDIAPTQLAPDATTTTTTTTTTPTDDARTRAGRRARRRRWRRPGASSRRGERVRGRERSNRRRVCTRETGRPMGPTTAQPATYPRDLRREWVSWVGC